MGVARTGKKRAPGSLETGTDAYRRARMPRSKIITGTVEHKVLGLVLVAIIALGYAVGWMRTALFGS